MPFSTLLRHLSGGDQSQLPDKWAPGYASAMHRSVRQEAASEGIANKETPARSCNSDVHIGIESGASASTRTSLERGSLLQTRRLAGEGGGFFGDQAVPMPGTPTWTQAKMEPNATEGYLSYIARLCDIFVRLFPYSLIEMLYESRTKATPVTLAMYPTKIAIVATGVASSVLKVRLTTPVRRLANKKTARPLRL